MNAELKTKWIAALRSGEYRQGRHSLRDKLKDGDRFCCLGVLCEVANVPFVNDDDDYGYRFEDGSVDEGMPRGAIYEDLKSVATTLASMNDSDEKSFTEIADWIERHVDAN